MSFAAQTEPVAPKFADIKVLPCGGVRMCPQPFDLIMDINDAPSRQKRVRLRWIVEGLLPEFSVRAYCKLCLGSGSTARAVRAPGTGASRRGADAHDDGSGGDADPDGPSRTLIVAAAASQRGGGS